VLALREQDVTDPGSAAVHERGQPVEGVLHLRLSHHVGVEAGPHLAAFVAAVLECHVLPVAQHDLGLRLFVGAAEGVRAEDTDAVEAVRDRAVDLARPLGDHKRHTSVAQHRPDLRWHVENLVCAVGYLVLARLAVDDPRVVWSVGAPLDLAGYPTDGNHERRDPPRVTSEAEHLEVALLRR